MRQRPDRQNGTFAEGIQPVEPTKPPEKPKAKRGRPRKVYAPIEEPKPVAEVMAEVKEHSPVVAHAVKHDGDPNPPRFKPDPKDVPWESTVQAFMTYPTGVEVITAISPDVVGIRFNKGTIRTAGEKTRMEDAGMRWEGKLGSWIVNLPSKMHMGERHDLQDMVYALAEEFHEERLIKAQQGRPR